ncbi:Transcriptional regulatory protein MucR [uncultured Gammaproteobacteria bacterium]
MSENTLNLTATVVSAYVGNNSVAAADLPGVIATVYDSLRRAGTMQATPEPQPVPTPAVSIRKSVQPDSITCLDCGRKLKMLKRHIATDHGLSVDSYRAKWDLPAEYPMIAPNYAQQRSKLAVKIGLGRGRGIPAEKQQR